MIPLGPPTSAGSTADPEGYVDLLALDDLPSLSQKSVAYGFQRVLLCHTPDGIHAMSDLCPHALQPLLGSEIDAGMIRCSKHGALFEIASGKPQNGVTQKRLTVYAVRICAGRIEVAVAGRAK